MAEFFRLRCVARPYSLGVPAFATTGVTTPPTPIPHDKPPRSLAGTGAVVSINYLFALVWAEEVIRSWTNRTFRPAQPGLRTWIIRGFFLFMFLNAGVIFVRGPARWVGLAFCLGLIAIWLFPRPADWTQQNVSIRQAEKTEGRKERI